MGNHLNKRKEKETLDNSNLDLEKNCNNSNLDVENIYDRQFFKKADGFYEKTAKERTTQSNNPKKTGVVPKHYNIKQKNKKPKMNYELFEGSQSDSEFSDDASMQSGSYSNNSGNGKNGMEDLLDKTARMMNNKKHTKKITGKENNCGGFAEMFAPLKYNNSGFDPDSVNASLDDNAGAVNRAENDRNLSINKDFTNFGESCDMTYGMTSPEHFMTDDMVPFTKKSHGGVSQDHINGLSQRKMELFSGSKNQADWNKKKEAGQFFSPTLSMTNTHGDPVRDFRGRYTPGRERRNELPFQPIKVGPASENIGANKIGGNFVKGNGGPIRVTLPTIDEIRGPKGPQVSYEGRTVEGQKGSKGPVIGKTEKRKPESFKEQDPKTFVKSFSNVPAPKVTGEIQQSKTANRGTKNTSRYGPAQSTTDKATPTNLLGKYKKTHKQTFEEDGPRNIYYVEGLKGRDGSLDDTHVPGPTKRTQENEYIGPAKRETEKGQYFDKNDVPQQNMRNVHNQTDRSGSAMTGNNKKGQYYDENDVPQSNMRNVHNQADRSGSAVTGNNKKGQYYDENDVPQQNMRNVHNQSDRTGAAVTGDNKKGQYYDENDVPQQNMRNVHNQSDRTGAAVTGDNKKGQYYDENDVPQQNMRNVHNKSDRTGAAMTGDHKKGQYYDENDVPQKNMRNIHNQSDRTGAAMTGDHKKGQYYDENDVPQKNMRNIHNQSDRTGAAMTGDHKKGQYYDENDVPQQNMRNVHNKSDRSGSAMTGDFKKGQYYDESDVPKQNMRNMHSKTDRNGTAITGDSRKGQYYDENDVPKQNMRNLHNKSDRNGTAITGDSRKGQYYDENDVPKQNMRNLHNKTDRSGTAITGDSRKGQYYDENDVPAPTMRNLHNYNDVGNAKNANDASYVINYTDATPAMTMRNTYNYEDTGAPKHATDASYVINYEDATPAMTMRNTYNHSDPGTAQHTTNASYVINYRDATPAVTQREITGETSHTGPARNRLDNPRKRDDVNNAQLNVTKEIVSKGRAPTVVKHNKGPTTKFTNYELKTEIDELEREYFPTAKHRQLDRFPVSMCKNKNQTYYKNYRINNHAMEILEGNPYVNNQINAVIEKN